MLAVLVKAQTAPVALLGCGEIVSSLDSAVDYGTRVDAPKIISQQHLPSEAAHGLQRKQQRQELLTVVCTESPAVSWAMLRRCSVHERRTNTPLSGFLLTREYLSHPAAFFLHWLDSFISVCVPYPLYLPSHPTDDLYDMYDLFPLYDLDLARQIYSRSCMAYCRYCGRYYCRYSCCRVGQV